MRLWLNLAVRIALGSARSGGRILPGELALCVERGAVGELGSVGLFSVAVAAGLAHRRESVARALARYVAGFPCQSGAEEAAECALTSTVTCARSWKSISSPL